MKTLDVASLQSGIDEMLDKLTIYDEQIKQIQEMVKGIISLEDSLKGNGGQSIRAFYQDCHDSFLSFYKTVIENYKSLLHTMKAELQSLEPADNGYIRDNFLQHDLLSSLQNAKNMTINLSNETNNLMDSVQDIVALPLLKNDDFLHRIYQVNLSIDQTVEKLHTFDQSQSTALNPVEQDIQKMNLYIQHIQQAFQAKDLSIETYNPEGTIDTSIMTNTSLLANHPRVEANGVETTHLFQGMNAEWDPTQTLGFNFNDWKEKPINAFASLGGLVATAYESSKDVRLAGQGFGVSRTTRVTAQGKEKVVLKVTRPDLVGLRKKTYSGPNATNLSRLYKYVDPATKVKDSFKWASNKLGYIGVGVTVAGDIVHGVQNNQKASEIAGNVTGDVVVAGASIAASAAAGAKVGALVGTVGGPVGVIAGTAVGAVAGIAVSTLLSDFKFMDVDNDGKSDSVGDAIKKGTTALIDKVGSWFD
ncbi:T7SS effector LXG polymorphic toxin [Metabacillus sediminilitoris]|nr:T7SS effector LXG polymorphic toxin [Metabacillus sediminilitoris]